MTAPIVFEPVAGEQVGIIDGTFKRFSALITPITLTNAILADFSGLVMDPRGDYIAAIDARFLPMDALLSPSSALIGAQFPAPEFYANSSFVDAPAINIIDAVFAFMTGEIGATQYNVGRIDAEFPRLDATISPFANFIGGEFKPLTSAKFYEQFQFVGGVGIVASPGFLKIWAPRDRAVIVEGLRFDDSQTHIVSITNVLAEAFGLRNPLTSTIAGLNLIAETVSFEDTLGVIWRLLVAETIALSDTPTPQLTAIANIFESIMLVGGINSSLAASNMIAEALALNDTISFLYKFNVIEQATFNDTFAQNIIAANKIVEEALLHSTASNSLRVGAVISEDVVFNGTLQSILTASNTIVENVDFFSTLKIGDDTYFAWVVNPKNRAFTSYTNYPFNSFVTDFEGRNWAMADDGLYELVGSDDDGDEINWAIRTGLSNLGSGKLKRLPEAFIGYTADEQIVIKVITTSPDGQKVENWYQASPRTALAMRENRVKFGRGLKSVYWEFEIVGSSAFVLDQFELNPMILERRLGGNGSS